MGNKHQLEQLKKENQALKKECDLLRNENTKLTDKYKKLKEEYDKIIVCDDLEDDFEEPKAITQSWKDLAKEAKHWYK